MFCPKCGQQNLDDATFCTKCGKQMTNATTAQPSSPSAAPAHVNSEFKDSGTVTAMSVVGFVFGLIGMLGSFIPCIGSLAFYIGIPAALISAIALGIAYSQNAKKTFAIVAVTISLIGVVISGWQYFSIISAGKNAERETRKMLNQGLQSNESRANAPTPAQRGVSGVQLSDKLSIDISRVHADLYRVQNMTSLGQDKQEIANLSELQLATIAADIALVKSALDSSLATEERKYYQTIMDNLVEYQNMISRVIKLAPVGTGAVYSRAADEKYQTLTQLLTQLSNYYKSNT